MRRGLIMDARDYDRIADLLMQIRKKYAQLDPKTALNKQRKDDCLDFVNAVLQMNDWMARDDGKGWL